MAGHGDPVEEFAFDVLRGLTQAYEIKAAASRLPGERLGASWAFYAEIDDIAGSFHIFRDWTDGTSYSMSDVVGSISTYGPLLVARARQGKTCVIYDSACDPLTAESAAAHARLGRRAFVNVPLVKGGHLIAVVSVHRTAAYHWRPLEMLWPRTLPSTPGLRSVALTPKKRYSCAS